MVSLREAKKTVIPSERQRLATRFPIQPLVVGSVNNSHVKITSLSFPQTKHLVITSPNFEWRNSKGENKYEVR